MNQRQRAPVVIAEEQIGVPADVPPGKPHDALGRGVAHPGSPVSAQDARAVRADGVERVLGRERPPILADELRLVQKEVGAAADGGSRVALARPLVEPLRPVIDGRPVELPLRPRARQEERLPRVADAIRIDPLIEAHREPPRLTLRAGRWRDGAEQEIAVTMIEREQTTEAAAHGPRASPARAGESRSPRHRLPSPSPARARVPAPAPAAP